MSILERIFGHFHAWRMSKVDRASGSLVGYQTRQCERCGERQYRILTARGHFPWRVERAKGSDDE